jgi:adenosylhomocysteine nucleosidase
MTMNIAIITGLTAEARIAEKLGVPVIVGGGTPCGAELAAEKLVAEGATALLSFGLAGGLDPHFRPGDIMVPIAVVEAGRIRPTDAALSDRLGGWFGGMLYAGSEIAVTAEEKAGLAQATLCGAIDLESGAVARVAERHGIPFAVLRAICDPAERDLPPAALAALNGEGAIAASRVALSIILNPLQIPGLIALGRDAGRARRALVRRVFELGDLRRVF